MCIGTEGLPVEERDVAVSKVFQMRKGEVSCFVVIQLNTHAPFRLSMAGHNHEWDRKVALNGCVDGDDAFDRAGEEHAWIGFHEFGTVTMADYEVEEPVFEK